MDMGGMGEGREVHQSGLTLRRVERGRLGSGIKSLVYYSYVLA